MIEFVISSLVTLILILIFVIDLRTRKIPNILNLAIFLLGLLALIFSMGPGLLSRAGGALTFSLAQLLFNRLIPGSFGGGDLKLTLVGGFLLGLEAIYWAVTIASLTSATYALYLLVIKKANRNTRFAFGPFLALGIFICYFQFEGLCPILL